MPYIFYLSYSRNDNGDNLVKEFFNDLREVLLAIFIARAVVRNGRLRTNAGLE
jgi:hypothetical protein